MTLSQRDSYPWTYYIFLVNKKKTKDVGELRQRIVEEWEQLGQHVIDNAISASMWLTMRSDSGTGDCEVVSMQMMDSLNILCDRHSDYQNGRLCRFLNV